VKLTFAYLLLHLLFNQLITLIPYEHQNIKYKVQTCTSCVNVTLNDTTSKFDVLSSRDNDNIEHASTVHHRTIDAQKHILVILAASSLTFCHEDFHEMRSAVNVAFHAIVVSNAVKTKPSRTFHYYIRNLLHRTCFMIRNRLNIVEEISLKNLSTKI